MSIATPDDVVARLGREATNSEIDMIKTLLDDVEQTILRRVPDLAQQLAATPPTISEKAVIKAESWAVIRYLRNPEGKTQEAIDDYSYTRSDASAGGLSLTDEEWEDILPAAASTAAFSITPSYLPDRAMWCP